MPLLTQAQSAQLLANGKEKASNRSFDPFPVVKLFVPDAKVCWLLAWIDPDVPDIAYGLCDTGMGSAVMTHVPLSELEAIKGPKGYRVAVDHGFEPRYALSVYESHAQRDGHVTD
ncbi:DUF2958 domain-containing protein [Alcaligenes faecalis]|uniref:DUF2958 domain-containing protein n=1 Tax=Alcaligenes faecalis TaxID=511 RepID=UPI001EF01CB0|nr:DUF2958 domain-containing protein [Alcaligenes faecalis]ULH06456.1 DUF2958 domain-containing protein [Alcaligenes faecalis]